MFLEGLAGGTKRRQCWWKQWQKMTFELPCNWFLIPFDSSPGVEPMGLFWSMIQSPGQKPGLRFFKRDVTTPMIVTLSAHKGHLDMMSLQTDLPITKMQVYRTYMGQDVEIVKVHSGRVRGRVFKPKGIILRLSSHASWTCLQKGWRCYRFLNFVWFKISYLCYKTRRYLNGLVSFESLGITLLVL